ncbi:MAG: c-type cytochrome [Planctomycetales bacterium]|nr:c-type cytochrome [Planctomycetales bacterium]
MFSRFFNTRRTPANTSLTRERRTAPLSGWQVNSSTGWPCFPSLALQAGVGILFSFLISAALSTADVIPHAQDKPPGPALSPQEAIKKMTVPEGFPVELVASEPDIVNPGAMTIDEKGRFWITESLEYPRRSAGPGKDRVKVLEDTDGDGRADKFTVFAEGLNIPSGIAVGHGGVWVANSPDILFMQDTDGDGKADKSEVVVTGFGRDDTHELPNSLTWGPDGWLYGLNGVFNRSDVKYPKSSKHYKENHPGWQFTCALFRIHPVTREFQVFCEGTSNPWGVAFDPEGSAFISACVIDHLWHLTETGYYHRQGGPYPPFTWKIESIVKHKHQKAAYCGIHYFDSDAYPEKYSGKLYMGNIHGGCLNVDKLQRDGSTYFATPEPDFLTANDAWFMPVVQKTGPDGSLYILDWYDRYHCYQDANRDPAGIDRLKGRLYRVRYKETPRAKGFDLAKEKDEQLIERLGAKNDFIRSTAQRLLYERQVADINNPGAAIPKRIGTRETLRQLIEAKETPHKQRMHALFVLMSTWEIDEGQTQWLMKNAEPAVQASIIRLLGNIGGASPAQIATINGLAATGAPDVKLQIAIAARKINDADPLPLLLKVLANCGDDKLIPHIIWQNLHPLLEENPEPFLTAAKNPEFLRSKQAAEFLPRAAERIIGRKKFEATAVAGLVEITRDGAPQIARNLLGVLSTKVQSGELKGDQLNQLKEALAETLKPLLAGPAAHPVGDDAALLAASWGDSRGIKRARQIVTTGGLQVDLILKALAALISGGDAEVLTVAGPMLVATPRGANAADIHSRILAMLSRMDDPKVAETVLKCYAELEPDVKPKAIQLLTQRTTWATKLVAAIGDKKIPAEALNVNQVRQLLSLNDKELTSAVGKHWGTVRTTRDPRREELVTQMKLLIRQTPGDATRGKAVYTKVCGQCHKMYGEGQEVGPDITLNGRSTFDQLLSNVFDPSLVIGASYQARLVKTTDGRVLTGLLAEDSPQRVVLKVQGGKQEVIPRGDVEMMKISELSLMPQDVEKTLKPEEIADLFSYITLDKPPTDPSAKLIPGTK